MVIGLYLWFLTLNTRDDFEPLFASQSDEIKSLMQTAVSFSPRSHLRWQQE